MGDAAFLPGLPHGNVLAFPLTLLIGVVVGLLARGTQARRRAAVALGLSSFVPPFIVEPEHSAVRLLTAMATVMVVLRSVDLYADRRSWSPGRRVWLMLSIWDSRRATFDDPQLDGRALVRALGSSALAIALGVSLQTVSTSIAGPTRLPLRWLLGAALVYAVFDALHAAMIGLHRAFGVIVPPFHHDPILSRSVGELWGTRWNMIVHEALARHLFRPLARRRRPWLGVAASFLASALLHAWLMLAALGAPAAISMGAYFLVQGVLLALERRLGVTRWRSGLRRTWTVVAVVAPSPLFVEPLITTLGF